MEQKIIFPFSDTAPLRFACRNLERQGIRIARQGAKDVSHLLLPVPSFDEDGRVRGGGDLEQILPKLSPDVIVVGGNLNHPLLEKSRKYDLLKDPCYVSQNAALTADGAVRIASEKMQCTFYGCPMLVIGWGRIGKCLAKLLQGMGAQVWVAVRKEQDWAMLNALGYRSIFVNQISGELARWQVIFNTAPAPVLTEKELSACSEGCVKIDLASKPGLEGADVIWARGIPGKLLPESSGALIARCILKKEG